MAHSYGPSKKPSMCNPRKVQVTSVRDWHDDTRSHPVQLTITNIENGAESGHEQWLRLTRLEAQTLLEALRRVLESEISASWGPAALEAEVQGRPGAPAKHTTTDGFDLLKNA